MMWKKKLELDGDRGGDLGRSLLQTQRPSFVRMETGEKKKPEAELGGFEGLQMQPAETL